jgi:hypothetical protein
LKICMMPSKNINQIFWGTSWKGKSALKQIMQHVIRRVCRVLWVVASVDQKELVVS